MKLKISDLGKVNYQTCLDAMKQRTASASASAGIDDELWLLQHSSVFTQGIAGKKSDVIDNQHIPVIASDRGGLITYHGPGQLIAYTLFNLHRLKIGPKILVEKLETTLLQVLQQYQIEGHRKPGAPGIYVNGMKIASIGLRIRKGYSYHGIALNVDMDLTPFNYINPCGYSQLKMTQMKDHTNSVTLNSVAQTFAEQLCRTMNYANQFNEIIMGEASL